MKVLKTQLNVRSVIIIIIDPDVKVTDHCHITGKLTGYAHRECNINVILNQKISIVFHNLKNYDSHVICKN